MSTALHGPGHSGEERCQFGIGQLHVAEAILVNEKHEFQPIDGRLHLLAPVNRQKIYERGRKQSFRQRGMGRNIESIPTHAMEALTNYDWPGNIRELQNVIERSVVLSNGPELRVALPEMMARSAPVVFHGRASNVTELSERARILQVLKETKGMV
jgi:hypothetical protein